MSDRGRSRRWDDLYYYPPAPDGYSDSGYHSTDTHKHRHKSHDHHRHRDDTHHGSRRRGRSSDPVHHSHHRTVARRHSYSLSPDRSSSRRQHRESRSSSSSWEPDRKWKKGAEAAAGAAAVEMFRTRHEHGSNTWKAVRVATAALTAAAVETAADKHPESHDHQTVAKSSIAGLLVNRIVNGSRHDARY